MELVRRAQGGDPAALERLCARYLSPLRRWASHRLPIWARDLLDTDDLVQDTLMHTLHRVADFEPRGSGAMHAYLRQAIQNRIQNELRRVRRKPPPGVLDEAVIDDGPSPLEQAVGAEAIRRYESALERLRPDEREAVVARLELDMGYAEIAAALGKPSPDAARMAVGRALVRLAEEMTRERNG